MRRPRMIAGLAAAAVVAVLAGPVSAMGRSVDFPSVPVLVDVMRQKPPVAAPAATRSTATVADSAAPVTGAARVLPGPAARALPASKPSDLVRVVYTIKANGAAPAAVSRADGACPAAPTCDIFGISAFRWKTDRNGTAVITYKYNDANRRDLRSPDPPAVRGAIHAAAATWNHWNSNIVINDTGNTTAAFGAQGRDGTCADGTNVITWGRFSDPDAVGVAGMCLDRTLHVIRDADLMLNINFWWSIGPNPRRATYDVQEILTHEMGHWLSLLDMYSPTANHQTMFGSADPNETRKRTPGLGDIVGLQTAYPCGSGDSCPRSEIAGD